MSQLIIIEGSILDYDSVFKYIKTNKEDVHYFLSFINHLRFNVNLRMIPTHEEFVILKESFKLHNEFRDCKKIEISFMTLYSGYLSTFKNDENFKEFILTIIKEHPFSTFNRLVEKEIIEFQRLIYRNIENFSVELSIKIIDCLFEIRSKYDDNQNGYNSTLVILIMSIFERGNIDIQYFKSNYRDQIYNLLMAIDNRNYICEPISTTPIEIQADIGKTFYKILSLYQDDQLKLKEITWKLLYIENSNNHRNNLNHKFDTIQIFKTKQQRVALLELILSCSGEQLTVKTNDSNNGNIISTPLDFRSKYSTIVGLMVMNYKFNLFNSLYIMVININNHGDQFLKDGISKNSGNISQSAGVYGNTILNYISHLPFNIALEFIYSLGPLHLEISKKKEITQIYIEKSGIGNENIHEFDIESIFRIDEFILTSLLGSNGNKISNTKTLSEIYKLKFNDILNPRHKISLSLIDLSSIVESCFFFNIENSPIKINFIKSNLNYLIQVLPIGLIDKFITGSPLFNNEQSKTYQIKSSSSISMVAGTVYYNIPNYLKIKIICLLVDDLKTSMFEKFEISLLSKSIFQNVVTTINESTVCPIYVNCDNFSKLNLHSTHSIIKNDAKFISSYDRSKVGHGSQIFLPPAIDGYRLNVVYEFHFTARNNKLYQFNSIEKLEYRGEITNTDINYFKWSKTLKHLTITTTNKIVNQVWNRLITELQIEKGIELVINLHSGVETPYENEFTSNDKSFLLNESIISIALYSRQYYLTCGSKTKKLTILVQEYFAEQNNNKYQLNGLIKKKWASQELYGPYENLEIVEFEFRFSSAKYLNYDYFVKLFSMFDNIKNNKLVEFIISFPTLEDSPKDSIENILKLLSSNQFFSSSSSNIKTLSIKNNSFSFNNCSIDNLNLHKFTTIDLSNLNLIKFIKPTINNNNNDNTSTITSTGVSTTKNSIFSFFRK